MNATSESLRRGERGQVSAEMAILIPMLVIMISMIVAGGRIAQAKSAVSTAADAGARAASLERTAGQARSAASEVAQATLANNRLKCGGQVTTDASGFSVPVGQPAQVSTTISCSVTLGDLFVPGLPGSWSLSASSAQPIDIYRGRS